MTKKIKIGDDYFTVDTSLAKAIENLKDSLTEEEINNENIKKDLDCLQAKYDEIESNKIDKDKLNDIVNDHVAFLNKVSDYDNGIEVKGLDKLQIMKKIISDKYKDFDFNDKSNDYIQARFDSILEESQVNSISDAFKTNSKNEDKEIKIISSDDARNNFLKNRNKKEV